MNKLLNKYWLEIVGIDHLPNLGITAYTEEDVSKLIKEKIKNSIDIKSIKIIKSLDELDQNHVIPNMEEFVIRGIWYPKGFK